MSCECQVFYDFAKLQPKYVETCKMWFNQNYIKYLKVIIGDTRIHIFLKLWIKFYLSGLCLDK